MQLSCPKGPNKCSKNRKQHLNTSSFIQAFMKCPESLKEIGYTFHPKKLNKLSNGPFKDCAGYVAKILAFAVLIMLILFIPQFGALPSFVSKQVAKFDNIEVSGTVNMSSAIRIPERDPFLIVDMTEFEAKPGKERVLVTKDYIYYRLLSGQQKVETKKVKEPTENRPIVSQLLTIIIIFVLPSVIFYTYLALLIKYFILIFLAGTIVFFLLDLTRFRHTWWKTIKLGCYASTIPIFMELILIPLNTKVLVPLFSIAGMNIYLVSSVLLIVLTGIAAVLTHVIKDGKNK